MMQVSVDLGRLGLGASATIMFSPELYFIAVIIALIAFRSGSSGADCFQALSSLKAVTRRRLASGLLPSRQA